MSFLDSLKKWFAGESAELSDVKDNLESRLDTDLSERERRLDESPTDAMERLQAEIDDESGLDEIRDKIDHTQAKADAVADLADDDEGSGEG